MMTPTEPAFQHDPAHAMRMADMLKGQATHATLEGDSKLAERLQKRAREWEQKAGIPQGT